MESHVNPAERSAIAKKSHSGKHNQRIFGAMDKSGSLPESLLVSGSVH
jgi:hypothetical protein